LALPGVILAQGQVLTFRAVDGSEQPYAVYSPPIEAGKTYPLVISLHMEQSTHRLNLRQVLGGDQVRPMAHPDAIVACPLARGTMGYAGIAERDVYDVVADVERRFPIDPDRVYLTGISMGGSGALRLALTRPDVWAAVAAVCPMPDPEIEALAGNAVNLPVRIYAGEQDPLVPVAETRAWQRRLVDAGVPAEYLEFPGVRHNAWVLAYREGAVFDWFAQFRRKRAPERVRLTAGTYGNGSAYWVRIDGMTPGTPATIDAARTGTAAVKVETKNVDGFTLTLPEQSRPGGLVRITIDGTAVAVKAGAPLSFQKAGGRWRAGLLQTAGKRPGTEGPIAAVVSRRHIYVYGTGGAASESEVEVRKKMAALAAEWAEPASPLTVELPVKADTEVTADELAHADLVLFGTRETNALVARFAAALPLELNPGAADYGLLMVAPEGERQLLVCSGLPWWSGRGADRRGGWPFAPAQLRLLSTFGDYILFKGSLGNVVAEGRFDREWKLPPDTREKIAASGTVTIH
jgi:pimeloyl-ACP methyl ester carboxylesterase